MEAWTDLYTELATLINDNIEEIKWVDLWHEQVNYLSDELPFPTPAVFIAFSTTKCDDMAQLIQECELQVDLYFFHETFADSYFGSYNQSSAIDYLKLLTNIHKTIHGKSGSNFQNMRRVDMRREESGGSGNLYRISFACIVEDASAIPLFNDQLVNEINLEKGDFQRPDNSDQEPLFQIGE